MVAAKRSGRTPIRISDDITLMPGAGPATIVVRSARATPASARRGVRSATSSVQEIERDLAAARRRVRSAQTSMQGLEKELAAAGFRTLKEIEIRPPARARAVRAAAPLAKFEVETAPDEIPVALVEIDGVLTWELPAERPAARMTRAVRSARPARKRWSIVVPRTAAPRKTGGRRQRSAILALAAGAVVKFLVFKAISAIGTQLIKALVQAREKKSITPGLKPVSNGKFTAPDTPPPASISVAPGSRILVFVHGTFSTCQGGFRALEGAPLRELEQEYGGRVFGFDHWSVSKSPMENMQEFLTAIENLNGVEVDFISHSRGGLVCRTIIEMNQNLAITPRRAVLVGTPNSGTPLADPKQLKQYLSLLTTVTRLIPVPGMIVLEIVFGAVQWLAQHGVGELPGLVAQNPSSPFIAQLNGVTTPAPLGRYSAVTANYEPDDGLLDRLKNRGMDLLFKNDNDLVVPTASVTSVDPAADPVVLVAERILQYSGPTVHHHNYFAQPATVRFLKQSLQ